MISRAVRWQSTEAMGFEMVSHGGFVAYYRVSTGKQGKSGLGIEPQRQAVATYLNGGNWRIIAEFTEIESGKRSDRPALEKALAAARVRQVPLVVAKVDELQGVMKTLMRNGRDRRSENPLCATRGKNACS